MNRPLWDSKQATRLWNLLRARLLHFRHGSRLVNYVMAVRYGNESGASMAFKTYTAADVAKYALASVDAEENDISNLKLQKLCYYAQGLVSAMRGTRLFWERVVAWDHGPVIQELYHQYKGNGSQPIPVINDFDFDTFEPRDRKALDDIFGHYGQFSPWRLRNMTHEEKPWLEAYNHSQGGEIPIESMIQFFRPQIDDEYVKSVYGEGQVQKGSG